MSDYEWADLIDKEDVRRMLQDPAGDYAKAAAWAMGRSKDDVIIEAANGNAFGGVDGGTSVAVPNTQKLASVSSGFVDMNIGMLRGIKKILDGNDVDESISRHCAFTSSQVESLLETTEITSGDFNSIKALVQGQINSFMGFEFHRTERLDLQVDALSCDTTTGVAGSGSSVIGQRRCIFWAQDGLLLATSQDMQTEIERRADKSYATQVYVSMGIGATRMEEEKVVSGLCNE